MLYTGGNDESRPLVSMTMELPGNTTGTYAFADGADFTLGGITGDDGLSVSIKSEGDGTITLTEVGDRVIGTISGTLRRTNIDHNTELYTVTGSFELHD